MISLLFDAGHGGKDSGAVNGNFYEKDVVLEIAKKTAEVLSKYEVVVGFTREDDRFLTLTQRSNKSRYYDTTISFHTNASSSPSPHGVQVYVHPKASANDRRIAQFIQNELDLVFPKTKWSGVRESNLHMVREPKGNKVLLELGFISNQHDLNILKTQTTRIAILIANGIIFSHGLKRKEVKLFDSPKKFKSIVEFLQANGMDYSFSARQKLAVKYGIPNYKGTASQNLQLLSILQG